jgi:hypothetical protein
MQCVCTVIQIIDVSQNLKRGDFVTLVNVHLKTLILKVQMQQCPPQVTYTQSPP